MKKEYIRKAAEHFLIQPLPKGWDKLNTSEQDEFIKENIWEPFEGWDTNFVWKQVEALAKSFQEVDEASVNRVLGQIVKNLNKKESE